MMPQMTARTLTIGQGSYPLVLPSIRDPRLHVAAVIISVHVLGQVGLGFWVSVPQILAAILTCAVIEVAITFRQAKAFVWPASAMLTGSGVALILRVVGTPPGQPWSTVHLEVFAAVAGLSLLSKYVIRYRGSHVFNPSNIGLVLAFLVLGSARAEPLDFWWAPLTNPAMVLAYAAIVVGGLLITRRLKLLVMAATYWLVLAAGLGLLAVSGHSIVTRWSFAPVSGFDYWRVIVTSPEVLIFLFFMITDPKTVPPGRVGRVAFAALVAVVGTLFMAPQTDEFGTKLGLLGGLMAVSAFRPLLERVVPAARAPEDSLRGLLGRLMQGAGPAPAGAPGVARRALGIGVAAMALLVVGTGIVVAGTPARGVAVRPSSEILNRLPTQVDPATLPAVTVGPDVADFDQALTGAGINDVLVTLAQNLEYENQAVLRGDASILQLVDHGDRLAEMTTVIGDSISSGRRTITRYTFDSVSVSLLVPFGRQDGFSLGFASRGTLLEQTYDTTGAVISSTSAPYDLVFAVRRATGDRWLLVGVLPPS
jgi:Na+-translocating ferredoxin:NAD+ oxidoreductase RnfD subunit